ncbi:hypothetical protein SDC9_72302 [bioreactor metagenome]|uniref:Uncharacterized protein n=1 Tax=bioreactor metagenome TaxID=1076179 RepID=A0A644YB11_9ZZZZ
MDRREIVADKAPAEGVGHRNQTRRFSGVGQARGDGNQNAQRQVHQAGGHTEHRAHKGDQREKCGARLVADHGAEQSQHILHATHDILKKVDPHNHHGRIPVKAQPKTAGKILLVAHQKNRQHGQRQRRRIRGAEGHIEQDDQIDGRKRQQQLAQGSQPFPPRDPWELDGRAAPQQKEKARGLHQNHKPQIEQRQICDTQVRHQIMNNEHIRGKRDQQHQHMAGNHIDIGSLGFAQPHLTAQRVYKGGRQRRASGRLERAHHGRHKHNDRPGIGHQLTQRLLRPLQDAIAVHEIAQHPDFNHDENGGKARGACKDAGKGAQNGGRRNAPHSPGEQAGEQQRGSDRELSFEQNRNTGNGQQDCNQLPQVARSFRFPTLILILPIQLSVFRLKAVTKIRMGNANKRAGAGAQGAAAQRGNAVLRDDVVHIGPGGGYRGSGGQQGYNS